MRMLVGVIASAVLAGVYAQGNVAWLVGFVMLVPWMRSLDASTSWRRTLLSAYAMSLAFTASVFAWFGVAIGSYTQVGAATGLLVLLLGAPLFQPQFFAFALVRHAAGRRFGAFLTALAGASAWVAAEWLVPRLLGDTLGHGLYPSRVLRQAADVGGAAGLTFLLLLANEGVSAAWARRQGGLRTMAMSLASAALVPLVLAGYGLAVLSSVQPSSAKPLRMGLIQSNLFDYERQRQEKGAYNVVREVLDLHFAMTYDAVVRQHADAVMWSETAYPTTFGHPKSAAGAELDNQILGIVRSAGVPFVFGTYDRDGAGEYNATAFVTPQQGLLGFYRKTRLFPLTEYVPSWLDGPTFRRWLPWTGTWRPGSGARVFPLRLADGREIPVLPMICLDDVDTGLAIDGARLGAQAILTMSNDSWFTDYAQGAALHQAVAAFRSIETRRPQFRVTTNGYSAVIDATGTVLAGSRMGERTLVIGDVPVSVPPRTLMLIWGDWVGMAGAGFLALLAMMAAFPSVRLHEAEGALPDVTTVFPAKVVVLPSGARVAAGALRAFARGSLLGMGVAVLFNEALRTNTLAQIRLFTGLFVVPELAAWCLLLAFAARAEIDQGKLVLTRGVRRLEVALRDIAAIEPWRVPIPAAGVTLTLMSGERWPYGLAMANPTQFARALVAAGCAAQGAAASAGLASRVLAYVRARVAIRHSRLNHPVVKYLALPLLLALPAFRLHQHIAYGGTFGEYYTFGLKAYLTTLGLWWAAWVIGVMLSAAALRAVIESGTLLTALLSPSQTLDVRRWLERLGITVLYVGVPVWLAWRVING